MTKNNYTDTKVWGNLEVTKNLSVTGTINGTATTATKLSTDAGSATQPIYFSGGKPVACTYALNETVPSGAVFTDTTYTFATGSANGTISVTPSGGTASNISVKGLGSAAYTDSTAYATSGHTHTASIAATSTGTSAITLAHGGKYILTAGGSSVIFTMPGGGDTDYRTCSYASTNTKLYLVGATTQSSSATTGVATVSNANCYVGTDNCLYSGGTKVLTAHQTLPTLSVSTSGSGNAITAISVNDHAITATKDTTFLTSHQSVTNKKATLTWSTTSTIATIGSTDITVALPANPNSDTKVNVTLGTTTKAYLLGTSTTPTSTATGVTAIADTGVYLDTTAGMLTATTFKGALSGTASGLSSEIANDKLPQRLRQYSDTVSASDTKVVLNGFHYQSSTSLDNNPFYMLHTSNADFLTIANFYSNNWGTQIASDFRSTDLFARRSQGGTWATWSRIHVNPKYDYTVNTTGHKPIVAMTADHYWRVNNGSAHLRVQVTTSNVAFATSTSITQTTSATIQTYVADITFAGTYASCTVTSMNQSAGTGATRVRYMAFFVPYSTSYGPKMSVALDTAGTNNYIRVEVIEGSMGWYNPTGTEHTTDPGTTNYRRYLYEVGRYNYAWSSNTIACNITGNCSGTAGNSWDSIKNDRYKSGATAVFYHSVSSGTTQRALRTSKLCGTGSDGLTYMLQHPDKTFMLPFTGGRSTGDFNLSATYVGVWDTMRGVVNTEFTNYLVCNTANLTSGATYTGTTGCYETRYQVRVHTSSTAWTDSANFVIGKPIYVCGNIVSGAFKPYYTTATGQSITVPSGQGGFTASTTVTGYAYTFYLTQTPMYTANYNTFLMIGKGDHDTTHMTYLTFNAVAYTYSSGNAITYIDGKPIIDNNTDTKVTQTVSTTNSTYPILACATANQTATSTNTAIFGKGIKINPSTSAITATTFSGTDGALSGNLKFSTDSSMHIGRTTDTGTIHIQGGSGESCGGRLVLSGKSRTTYGGWAELIASDGTNTSSINIRPGGHTNISNPIDAYGTIHAYYGFNLSGDSSNPISVYQKNGSSSQTTFSNITFFNASSQGVALMGGVQSDSANQFRLLIKSRDDTSWSTAFNFSSDGITGDVGGSWGNSDLRFDYNTWYLNDSSKFRMYTVKSRDKQNIVIQAGWEDYSTSNYYTIAELWDNNNGDGISTVTFPIPPHRYFRIITDGERDTDTTNRMMGVYFT